MKRPDQIITYTGVRFAPLNPHAEGIRIADIAHSLSLLCRANGHFKQFFSVAQHSLNCAEEAGRRGLSKKMQLACLLHDASEAYISDVTRPVKRDLPAYAAIEKRLQECIWDAFRISLTPEETAQMGAVDDAMLYAEFEELMGERIFLEMPEIKSAPDLSERDFRSVESEYKARCEALMADC